MSTMHHAVLSQFDLVQDFVLSKTYAEYAVYDVYYERLGINEAKELIKKAQIMPLAGKMQCLLVRAEFVTHEAQNALLKILEEPPQSTCFVFVLPTDFILLSTLASRFKITETVKNSVENQQWILFLGQSYADRLSSIEKELKLKNISWQQSIKRGLLDYLQSCLDKDSLFELEFITRWLLTRGASNKMLLEHLALILPIRAK